jgi:hypothetical protein
MLPNLESCLLLAAVGVQQVSRHLVVDLQHAELHLIQSISRRVVTKFRDS